MNTFAYKYILLNSCPAPAPAEADMALPSLASYYLVSWSCSVALTKDKLETCVKSYWNGGRLTMNIQ